MLAAQVAANAQLATYRVDPAATMAAFTIGHADAVSFRGVFRAATGTIAIDPGSSAGRVEFIVDARSVATGWRVRDEFIRSELIFDSEHFPVIRFRSTRLEFEGSELKAVEGDLTLRGVTRGVRLDVASPVCNPSAAAGRERCVAQVSTRIRRSDYGIDFATALVGDDVELSFDVVAVRQRDAGNGKH